MPSLTVNFFISFILHFTINFAWLNLHLPQLSLHHTPLKLHLTQLYLTQLHYIFNSTTQSTSSSHLPFTAVNLNLNKLRLTQPNVTHLNIAQLNSISLKFYHTQLNPISITLSTTLLTFHLIDSRPLLYSQLNSTFD
jgi:hypothetical protein